MRSWRVLACLMLAATMLTACGAAQATESKETSSEYKSDVFDTSFEGALQVSGQLVLGTLQLEETEHAVTQEQAKTLLPLWRGLQGGVTAEQEVNAVLRGIEGAMTEEQLATIAAMALTEEDAQAWVEEQGLGAGGGFAGAVGDADARATRRAETGGEGMPSGENIPPEMATRMSELESMSEEERETMMATAQAGGGVGAGLRGGAGGGAGAAMGTMGQLRFLLRPLITMLETRAGEA